MIADLDHFQESGAFSPLDLHFARFVGKVSKAPSVELLLAAALVSRLTREGHICLDLSWQQPCLIPEAGEAPVLPEAGPWGTKLRQSGVVGEPGEHSPLILDPQGRLYLYRYWQYQEELAEGIKNRIVDETSTSSVKSLRQGLNRIFPALNDGAVDWQKVAAFAAARRRFCVITGGPGTGKTTTVAKILALLTEQNRGQRLRTALISPTGKGAARLQEAMKKTKEHLACDESVKAMIPDNASTIHRLLGPITGSPYFRFNAQNPLVVDAVVVDEASMVDLALMSKLVQALSPQARFLLLGDKNQLSSVEAGAVLGDICDTGQSHPFSKTFCAEIRLATGYEITGVKAAAGMSDSIVQLTRSYRFGEESGMAAASCSVNQGDADDALKILQDARHGDLRWKPLPSPKSLLRALGERGLEEFHHLFENDDPQGIFERLDRFRVLCALRQGPFGVNAVNALVEHLFREQKLIRGEGRWYRGRPVLITQNDYNLHLYNGDIGITLPDPKAGGDLRVFFQTPDGALRAFHPVRLPEHETVYALTVHKSQGSEFDRLLLILPDRDSLVLTRELIYTGITRAREEVEVWGQENVFREAVARRTTRMSGLRDALWGQD
jgi:exodeoxyribonuclease V alpha subunit